MKYKVGDKVKYEGYEGYIAVIDPNSSIPCLLRLEGFDGNNKKMYWQEDWYPENEKKEEENCTWVEKSDIKLLENDMDKTIAEQIIDHLITGG